MNYKDKFLAFFASSIIFAAATISVAKPAIKALPELKTSVSAYATATVIEKSKQPNKAYFTKPIFYHNVANYV